MNEMSADVRHARVPVTKKCEYGLLVSKIMIVPPLSPFLFVPPPIYHIHKTPSMMNCCLLVMPLAANKTRVKMRAQRNPTIFAKTRT